jgi:hypothetical protein
MIHHDSCHSGSCAHGVTMMYHASCLILTVLTPIPEVRQTLGPGNVVQDLLPEARGEPSHLRGQCSQSGWKVDNL